ncbi:fructosamine-3-kinase [Thermus oshimai JL-2]|uniref:Fructosamine-3-kinase n=1 Tax=Thermus oshimai JL-2 TaxID=751945 RepID=K7QX33_THEOS|nr:fructosamine kinase family protein [Thermus oshimai]AFV76238.1 fructosamine-3-kinase [Thermus oshimai JL-2]
MDLLERAGLPRYPLEPLSGGDMARVYRAGPYVLKLHPHPPPGFFPAEARGLRALEEAGVRVPRVYWVGEEGLVLEYLPPGPEDWEALAHALARLHRARREGYRAEPGFLGTFPLPGGEGRDWRAFFFEARVLPFLEATRPLLGALAQEVERAFQKPLPTEGPVLLHGDLWRGNVHFARGGPALLDPSPFVGERGVDLAMMRLFGGFPEAFWRAYEALYPIPQAVRRALSCYQIYYLLAHVHFFGAGYLPALRRALSACVS